jgi:hypothetical protein
VRRGVSALVSPTNTMLANVPEIWVSPKDGFARGKPQALGI